MENSVAFVKPKPSPAEKKIIEMVPDALPSENSHRAYRRTSRGVFVRHAAENRLKLNKALVNRHVKLLRGQNSYLSTNQKLSAIRKLAYAQLISVSEMGLFRQIRLRRAKPSSPQSS